VKETIQWERNKFVWLHLKTLLLIAVFRDLKVLAWKQGWTQCSVQFWKCTEFCIIASCQIKMWCNILEEGKFSSWYWFLFLGVFAKLWKVPVCFFMSVCPHGTTWLPLDGLWWNFIFEYLKKNCLENSSFIKIGQELWVLYINATRHFFIMSHSVLPRMRNVSDKSCRGNQNTHFVFNNFFLSCCLWDNVEE